MGAPHKLARGPVWLVAQVLQGRATAFLLGCVVGVMASLLLAVHLFFQPAWMSRSSKTAAAGGLSRGPAGPGPGSAEEAQRAFHEAEADAQSLSALLDESRLLGDTSTAAEADTPQLLVGAMLGTQPIGPQNQQPQQPQAR